MAEKFVKPGAPGAVVIHPSGARLPPAGEWWPYDQFLMRRLRDGDVVEATPPAADEAPTVKPAAPAAKIKE